MPKHDIPQPDDLEMVVLGDSPTREGAAEVAAATIRVMRDSGHPLLVAMSGVCSALGAALGGSLKDHTELDEIVIKMAQSIRKNALVNWLAHNESGGEK